MENLKKDLELMDVTYENKSVILAYVDADEGMIYDVKFNLQAWDSASGSYVDDEEKEKTTREKIKEIYGVEFEELDSKIGDKRDIYAYERFNALEPFEIIDKFPLEDEGTIIITKIEEVEDNGNKIMIKFRDDDDKLRVSNMNYSEYNESLKKWFINSTKRNTQYAKFKDKFGVDVENADEIVGKDITVEVKVAFGKHTYAEIKKPKWSK